jgi:hypothetical protein
VENVFNDVTQAMWQDGVKFDNLLLLVTTAPSYMKNAAALSVNYPKVIHVMCTVHVLHTVCRKIHMLYPNVDKFMANG